MVAESKLRLEKVLQVECLAGPRALDDASTRDQETSTSTDSTSRTVGCALEFDGSGMGMASPNFAKRLGNAISLVRFDQDANWSRGFNDEWQPKAKHGTTAARR